SLHAALERVRPLAQARQIELRARGLEAGAEVRAEAEDLEQVWVNLLENAIQYSPPGETVEVECAAEGAAVAVSVRDHGCGIPAAQLPYIFDRFHRGPKSQGFGLGLAIARGIVEAAGGQLQVESSAAGTCLRAVLPAAVAPEA
ncbi:MAG: sensor histidine kinase, partial [Terriglobales bacterium]